jgi:hypothetical protein
MLLKALSALYKWTNIYDIVTQFLAVHLLDSSLGRVSSFEVNETVTLCITMLICGYLAR